MTAQNAKTYTVVAASGCLEMVTWDSLVKTADTYFITGLVFWGSYHPVYSIILP